MLRTDIKKHLETKGSITRLEAIGLYGCMDITTVIRDLRRGNKTRESMTINAEARRDPNGKNYARYTVAHEPAEAAVS